MNLFVMVPLCVGYLGTITSILCCDAELFTGLCLGRFVFSREDVHILHVNSGSL